MTKIKMEPILKLGTETIYSNEEDELNRQATNQKN